MQVFAREEVEQHKERLARLVKGGALFVHQSDLFYSLSCNAEDEEAIDRLRKTKECKRPFAIVAPSKEWIYSNFEIPSELKEHVDSLPGNGLFMLKLSKKGAVAENVHNGSYIVGVRMPKHTITDFAKVIESPIIITAANVLGKESARNLKSLDDKLRDNVQFFVDDGDLPRAEPLSVFNSKLLTEHRIRIS